MDWTLPTTQVMGKFNKWTEKDTALFRTALSKTGQVIVQIQASEGDYARRKVEVISKLTEAGFYHQHEFEVMRVPNVIHLTYTPNKNYIVEKISL